MNSYRIKYLVYTSIFTALVFVATTYIAIPSAFGYLNISDGLIMLLTTFIPFKASIFIASVATSLADVFSGYGQYAMFTFFIKSLMVIVIYMIYIKLKLNYFLSIVLAELVMLICYGLTDVFLYGTWNLFAQSLISNLPQAIICILIALTLKPFIRKVNLYGTK